MTIDPLSGLFTSANPSAIAMFGARDEADFLSRAPWQYSTERQPNGRIPPSSARRFSNSDPGGFPFFRVDMHGSTARSFPPPSF